jgi:ATP-dependent Clp protease ATP-binding subunit ClpA
MFRRFSPRAREVVISAQQEARALHHGFVGTEHLLLGLLRDRDGVAGRALHVLGISPEAAREQVLDIIGEGQAEVGGHIPLTPRSKKVLELAVREAVHLGHLHVGTEHILLGLVREGDGVGWHVLHRLGLTVPKVRDEVLQLVSQDRQAPDHVITPPGTRDYDTRIELARQPGRGGGRERLDRPRRRKAKSCWPAGPPDRAVVGRGGHPHPGRNSTGCATR